MTLFEFSIFGFHIVATWYGLMYALGFIFCFQYMKHRSGIHMKDMENLLLFIFFGVILGWRLWYVIFYDLWHFISSPGDIFAIWKWGMSFHGGMIGVIIAMITFSYRYHYRLFDISDPLVTILPLALWLGRIGNYLNQELLWFPGYTWPFAMMKDGISYFPSPLFQAFLEGVILLCIMQLFRWREEKRQKIPWRLSTLFLMWYGFLRLWAEVYRLPDAHIGYLFGTDWMTLGMIYTLPMIIAWITLLLWVKKRKD